MSQEKPAVPTNLPGNSYSSKKKQETERKVPEKIVTGEVVQRKKPLGRVGAHTKSVFSYIFFDVIVPAGKEMLNDAIRLGSERAIFGETRQPAKKSSGYSTYGGYGSSRTRPEPRSITPRGRATHNFEEIFVSSRGEAEEIIDQLIALVEDYGHAKVSDLYSMIGTTSNHVDHNWGWTDLSTASSRHTPRGYLLDMPPATPLRV